MTGRRFEPNPKAVALAVADLAARQPGGGHLTPDDRRLVAARRMWSEAPGSNGFLFWAAVRLALDAP